jgi:hypothetical protein
MILFVPVRCATPKFGDFLKDELWIARGKRSHRITLVTHSLAFGDASDSTAQHPDWLAQYAKQRTRRQ